MTLFEVTEDNLGIDENKNYLEELVGDGKKFKDNEALARSKAESDAYIKLLLAEKDEMRNETIKLRKEADAKAKLEELIDRMQNTKQSLTSNDDTDVNGVDKPLFDPKTVESRMYEIVAETKRKELEDANYNTVVEKLQEKFGPNFQSTLKSKVKELGLNDQAVENMARTMPQVLIRSLGLDEPAPRNDFSSPRSSVRTDNFAHQGGPKRDWSYYQKVRKENPELYHSPKFTVQRHKDVQEMGERAFYGSAYDEE